MRVTDKPRTQSEAIANSRAVCEVCGGADNSRGDFRGTVEVHGRRVYCWGCFPHVGGLGVEETWRDVRDPWALNVPSRPEDLCACGTCRLVGSDVCGGARPGFVLWFVFAQGEVSDVFDEVLGKVVGRRVEPGPTESMFLRGTCDKCGEHTSAVIHRLRIRSQEADPVAGWKPGEPPGERFRFEYAAA